MTRERDFYNLTLELIDRAIDPRDATGVAGLLTSAINFIRTPGDRGGVLYIARVPGGQLWIDVDAFPLVRDDIELHLGAGVVLVPVVSRGERTGASMVADSTRHHLSVAGGFRAPQMRVFPTLEWYQANAGETGRRYDLAAVRFTSRGMDRVHPEWWGAGDRPESTSNDSAALEACVRAAITERVADGTTAAPRLRALPIELRDTYVLARPLVIARDARREDGIELRGVAGGDENPTFVCAPEFPRDADAAMLTVQNFEAVTLDEVRFDARGLASRCLSLAVRRTDTVARGAWLRRCGFHGANEGLVDVTVVEGAASNNGTVPSPVTAEDMRFEGCRFTPGIGPSTLPTALHISTPPLYGVEIRGCLFEGGAAAMIHARSCALSVTNCQFSNNALPRSLQGGITEDLHRDGPEGGVDIFLDVRPSVEMTSGMSDAERLQAPRRTPATLYAQDCRSSSIQFLATCRDAYPTLGRDCTIIGLHHEMPVEIEQGLIFVAPPQRPPPVDDYIIPDPTVPTKVTVPQISPTKALPIEKQPAKATANQSPGLSLDASAATLAIAASKPATTPLNAIAKTPLDAAVVQGSLGPSGATITVSNDFLQQVNFRGVLLPAPIHWRIPTEAGQWLTLTGCRFDGPYSTSRPAVRGFAGCGPIGDLGAFSANVASVIETDGGDRTLMTVPRVGA